METFTNDRNAQELADLLRAIAARQQAQAMAIYIGGFAARSSRGYRR